MLSRQVILRASRAAAPQRAIASQVRFYAAAPAAAANENVKPPVTLFGIDGTYATALVRFDPIQFSLPTGWLNWSGGERRFDTDFRHFNWELNLN